MNLRFDKEMPVRTQKRSSPWPAALEMDFPSFRCAKDARAAALKLKMDFPS